MKSLSLTNETERLDRLRMCLFSGFGSRSLRKIGAHLAPSVAWNASSAELEACGIPTQLAERFCTWRTKTDSDALLHVLEQQAIRAIFRGDADYPELLEASSDPAEVLFVRGTLTHHPCVALVGSRKITSYGQHVVELLVPGLVEKGFCLVSGLALGVDGAVHEQCLHHQGMTVAILGGGIDDATLYPRTHVALGRRIVEQGGAIISEFPPFTQPRKEYFPVRNRLIASLSQATVVIEATEKSGSLITAKLALEENREVMAVPGPIWSEQSKGCHQLLKAGAKPCTCALDVLEAVAYDHPDLINAARSSLPLDATEREILHALHEPTHADALAQALEIEIAVLNGKLALLEMKGLVKALGGQGWVKY